jgi:hypothetical protein
LPGDGDVGVDAQGAGEDPGGDLGGELEERGAAGLGRRAQRNEAARLTEQLMAEGFSKKQVGEILGRNPSLVSQFFTKNKGGSFVEALRAVVQEVQAGGPRGIESL